VANGMKRVLVTGAGGIGGVNFVRALRASKEKFFIIGTDFNPFYLQFPDVDVRTNSPRHSDPNFIKLLTKLIDENKIDFLHPQPSSEAQVVSKERELIDANIFLPKEEVIARDKLATQLILEKIGLPVAKTKTVQSTEMIDTAFESFKKDKLWVRSKSGAGGNLSLLCNNSEEAKLWINLWVKKGKAKFNDFMIQEYLPGRNLAWDSIWYEGKMIASFTRERLEYPFKHISPSGITGTPTVSRIIIDESINKLGENAVKAIDPMPHGNYAVDLKDDPSGKPCITEIDAGKFHSTTPLWGYISTKILQKEPMKNLPYLYLLLGIGEIDPPVLGHDIYPEGLYLLRHIDCGDWLWREDGYKAQIL
jgi:carbamoyl-phosphate synthase large subunit